ncbi:hypothetical protein AVEN_146861-1 [Araneus ventricosus]|uniref:DUF4817 domain-containing protein n=1 Tax=Araneus ventricosus TaxID=182803 RepID=A0A4Y2Q1U5_ARAVE|nr:hypothetical protein AVEN_146861-1 [Araneus ventricosus]
MKHNDVARSNGSWDLNSFSYSSRCYFSWERRVPKHKETSPPCRSIPVNDKRLAAATENRALKLTVKYPALGTAHATTTPFTTQPCSFFKGKSSLNSFLKIGNVPLRSSKSAAARDSRRKSQKGYCAAEGTLWLHESKSIVTVRRRFRLEYRNGRSPSKNSNKRRYEQFKRTGNVHERKGAGRPSGSDEVVELVREHWSSYLETDNLETLGESVFALLQLICFRGNREVPSAAQ